MLTYGDGRQEMGDRKQKTGDKRHRWEMRHSEGSTTGDPQPLKCKECQEKVVKKIPTLCYM